MRSGRFITGHFTITGPGLQPVFSTVSITRHDNGINGLATRSVTTMTNSKGDAHAMPTGTPTTDTAAAAGSPTVITVLVRYAHMLQGLGGELSTPLMTRACIANGQNVGRTRGRCRGLGGGGSHGGR